MKKFFLLSILLLSACASISRPIPTLTSTLESTQTITKTATLDPIEAQKLVRDLLENNAGCKLPCWWGITPGKTTWADAHETLEKISLSIGGQESEDVFAMSVQALLPYPNNFAKYMEHLYVVKNGIVDYIRVYNFDLAPNYYLVNLLETYGQPSEVWMRTRAKEQMGIQHFIVDVFYQELGILVEYSTGDPMNEVEGKLQNCMIRDMDSPFIHLWSPENQNLSFQDAKKFIDTMNLPEPKPLLDATGMDVETFYKTFKNPETDVCLETPKNLWP